MKRAIRNKSTVFFVAACAFLAPLAAIAQGLEFSGTIRAGVAQSDNIFLLPPPDETEETTYIISPTLNLDYSNQRIESLIRYQYDWFRYSDLDTKNEYHRYDARLDGTLVEDALYLGVGASRSQSIVDPDAVIPSGGLPISNNLADRDEYFVNPKLEKTLGRSVTALLDYRYTDIRYDGSDLEVPGQVQDNVNQTANVKLENYKGGQGLTWAAAYEWRETEYDLSLPWEYQRASAELGFWASGSTRIFASGGKESPWDDPVDRSLQDEFWEAGFAYQGSDRVSAEFAAGERSFGSSWRGRLDWSFRRGSLAFSYAETPTTNGFDRYSRGNLINPEEPNDFLAFPGSSERYISQRGQASLSLEFRRTTLNLVAYDEQRTGRYTDDGTPLEDLGQTGISATVDWRPGIRTDIAASGSINAREDETGRKSDFITGTLSASYRLGSAIGLTLAYQYSEQDPREGATGRDYVSNVIAFYATYSF